MVAHFISLLSVFPAFPPRPVCACATCRSRGKNWEKQAFEIEKGVRNQADENPLMVGMDRYFMASELAYYDGDHDGSEETAGRSLFGAESLMYNYWFPADKQNGRNMILFGFEEHQLNSADLANHFQRARSDQY